MSRMRARTSRISDRVTPPTSPLTESSLSIDTDLMCWHWAAESSAADRCPPLRLLNWRSVLPDGPTLTATAARRWSVNLV